MKKTTQIETDNKLTVDIIGLQAMLSVGRDTAAKTAEAAGAVIHLGRRKLYNVNKVEAYLNSISEG